MLDLLRGIIIVQIFFGFAMTAISYVIPDDAKVYADSYFDVAGSTDINQVTGKIQEAMTRQTNIPLIDLGALVFYSGNFILDLFVNMAFAIPIMIGLIVNGLMNLFNLYSPMVNLIEITVAGLWLCMYFMGLIQMLLNMRTRAGIQ
jgi:hypothetical protein